jgi:DNA-binding NtrC family response regulator
MTRILLAEDDPQMQLAIKTGLSRAGYELSVAGDGRAALELYDAESFELIISDQRMPEMSGQEFLAALQKRDVPPPFIMITAYGTITQAVEAMQLGASDFITKPFSIDDLLRVIERVLSPEGRAFRSRSSRSARKGRPIITSDPVMIRILEICEAVARSDATVLVQGESGTGKELIARLIHSASPRNAQPFVAVNCAAMPDTLLESELFGHEKGSFTGAQNRKIGKFELAQGGTILLDEISEMPLALQAKLLRVLQEREVDRVGGREPVSIDVRVIATTNRNLQEAVSKGAFRADLYYRLNVIPITLPPLRQKKGDIRLLVEHFMNQYLGEKSPGLTPAVLQALEAYSWPGNVRELQNAVERAAILSAGGSLKQSDFLLGAGNLEMNLEQHLEKELCPDSGDSIAALGQCSAGNAADLTIRSGLTVQEMEKALIIETLKATEDNRTEAARLLGISIRTLRNKLHEYNGEALTEE